MIEILFEDDYLVIVNKPAMVLSQPSFNKDRKPIKEMVEEQRPDLKNKLFLHHRLDYETSGVFLMSKNSTVNKAITEMFQNHHFEKAYVCLSRKNSIAFGKKVEGQMKSEQPQRWTIKSYMAPAKGMGSQKKRMISVRSGGWPSETEFEVLQEKAHFLYIKALPKTGRTHQIRHHMQESHRSILGDNIYGGKSPDVPRLMLHAQSLKFNHPHTGTELFVEAPVPKDFLSCLDK